MRSIVVFIFVGFLFSTLISCEKETIETKSILSEIERKTYYDSEIFSTNYLRIYGKWKLFDISGGFTGYGYKKNFDYLEIKGYGIYGFIRNDTLLEYGKIVPVIPTYNGIVLSVSFEEDMNSMFFIHDKEKTVYFQGNDTMSLNAPCCDRYNYHFERVK